MSRSADSELRSFVQISKLPSMPPNTVLFCFADGVYAVPKVRTYLVHTGCARAFHRAPLTRAAPAQDDQDQMRMEAVRRAKPGAKPREAKPARLPQGILQMDISSLLFNAVKCVLHAPAREVRGGECSSVRVQDLHAAGAAAEH